MPLVNAKCTNCGATLTVDNEKDAAVCQFCGSAFIVEKAINNYISNVNISTSTTINSENTMIIDSEKQRAEEKIAFDVENGIKNEYFKDEYYQSDIRGEINRYLNDFPAGEFGYQHYVTWEINCFPYLKIADIPFHVNSLKRVMANYRNVKNAHSYNELANAVVALMRQMEDVLQKRKESDEKSILEKKSADENEIQTKKAADETNVKTLTSKVTDYTNKIQNEENKNKRLNKEKDTAKRKEEWYEPSSATRFALWFIAIILACGGIFIAIYCRNIDYVKAVWPSTLPFIMGAGICVLILIIKKVNCVNARNTYDAKISEINASDKVLSQLRGKKNELENELYNANKSVDDGNQNLKNVTEDSEKALAALSDIVEKALIAVREY